MDAQVDRERHRLAVGAGLAHQLVEAPLGPGQTLAAGVGEPDEVRRCGPERIDPPILLLERHPRQAEVVQLLLLLGGEAADQIDSPVAGQRPVDALGGQARRGAGQRAARLGLVPDFAGIEVGAVMHEVQRQQPAVAVHEVGPGHLGRRSAVAGAPRVEEQGLADRPAGEGGEGGGEQHKDEEDAVAGVLLLALGLGVLEGVLQPPHALGEPDPDRRYAGAGEFGDAHGVAALGAPLLGSAALCEICCRSPTLASCLPGVGCSPRYCCDSRPIRSGCSR